MANHVKVSSIPDDLTGISKSLFTVLDRVRADGWKRMDEYMTEHIFEPLDDHIQAHYEVHARDRIQGTVKQRKQGHKRPPLPFVQATEYDIRNFSPEYKKELETDLFPQLLRKCLDDIEGKMLESLEMLLRSEKEVQELQVQWRADSTFEAFYERNVEYQALLDEYELKKELIAEVNARTKLLDEYTTYYAQQVVPFWYSGTFSYDHYVPPPDTFRKLCDEKLSVVNASLEAHTTQWEAKQGQEMVVRGERYLETLKKDVWKDLEQPQSDKPTKASPTLARRQSAQTGGAATRGGAVTPRKSSVADAGAATKALTPSGRRPSAPAASPRRPSVSPARTPAKSPGNVPAMTKTDLPKPQVIMDRPISHIRPPKDKAKFDPSNTSGGRRIQVLEQQPIDGEALVDDPDTYIKVACRIRPMLQHEKHSEAIVNAIDDTSTVQLERAAKNKSATQFELHYVAGPEIKQLEFYNTCHVVPLLDKALKGSYVTVFAYGQTGSGKTHTIAGPEDVVGLHEGVRLTDPHGLVPESVKEILRAILHHQMLQHGIMPRGGRYLFDQIVDIETKDPNTCFDVRCTYVEIYNEQIFDLLSPKDEPLECKVNTGEREGFYVAGITEVEARTTDDVMRIFMDGAKNRRTAAHALNTDSSRSHALFTMIVDRKIWNETDKTLWVHRGKVTLVDLAGSESIKATKTSGRGLLETQGINTSLLHLSNIISGIAKDGFGESMAHIPWRNSKLTMLLMESLANMGNTLMIANVSPASEFLPETTNTLTFATKAANIKGRKMPKPSSKPQEIPEIDQLRADVTRYRSRTMELETRVQELERLLRENKIAF